MICCYCNLPIAKSEVAYLTVRRPDQNPKTFVPLARHKTCDEAHAASGKGRSARIAREDARVSSKDVKPKKTIVRRNP